MENLIVALPVILVALARVIEASAIVVLAFRKDAPLSLGEDAAPAPRRLRLRARLRGKGRGAGETARGGTGADAE